MSDLETRVRRIEAREEIRRSIYKYALAGDRKNDPEILRTIFAEDIVYEAAGMGVFNGLTETLAGLGGIAANVVPWSFHAASGPLITLADDLSGASAFWWIWVPGRMRDGEGGETPMWGAGHYNATLAPSGETWLFKTFLFEPRFLTPFAGPWTELEGPFTWPTQV